MYGFPIFHWLIIDVIGFALSRNNFFAALYLAHDMEDECDEDKWEILPWALGRRWKLTFPEFIKTKNQVFFTF